MSQIDELLNSMDAPRESEDKSQQILHNLRLASYDAAGIPRDMWQYTLEHWNERETTAQDQFDPDQSLARRRSKHFVQRYMDLLPLVCARGSVHVKEGLIHRPVVSLIFEGKNRSGKTFLASMIAKAACDKGMGHKTKYIEWGDILDIMKMDSYSLIESQFEIKALFQDSRLLCVANVEELGDLRPSAYSNMRNLIRGRLNTGYPTILTTSFYPSTEHPWADLIHDQRTFRIVLPTPRAATSKPIGTLISKNTSE